MTMALRSMVGLSEPHMLELPGRRLATVVTTGDPDKVGPPAVKALYLAVDDVRTHNKFELEPLRVRWPMQQDDPRDEWVAMWGVPVPADVEHMPRIDEEYPANVQEWEYGAVAEVLHEGSRAEKRKAIDRLYQYMSEQHFEVIGPHEEEYLSPPDAAVPRTFIRYRVRLR